MKSQFKTGQYVVVVDHTEDAGKPYGEDGLDDWWVLYIKSVRGNDLVLIYGDTMGELQDKESVKKLVYKTAYVAAVCKVVKKKVAAEIMRAIPGSSAAEALLFIAEHPALQHKLDDKERVVLVKVPVMVINQDRCSNDCQYNSFQNDHGGSPWCSLYDEEMVERSTRSPHKRVRCSMCLTGQLKDEEVVDEAAGPALTLLPGGLQ